MEGGTAARKDRGPVANLGSCYLGKYPWDVVSSENTLGMLSLEKKPVEST